ncbi:sulfur carrier protein ThiS [Pseudomonas brenneri]|jgi:sulfur carrier protein|uniref:Sulfur carrier protein ThiS n=2 Tax=Pseudomonas brenneri TaxID=129817 RepID=A0ABY0WKN5_9PSED|nr:sulfur carrier protein ThiS [Pseudomonas brenneri]SDV07365.1 sulfur carrier protein ThiS [Pseudomonas brenneri]
MLAPKNDGGPGMRIQLNGEPYELPDGETVAALLARLELTGRRVAVELNQDIVPRSQHPDTALAEGDQVEVVHAIGGG